MKMMKMRNYTNCNSINYNNYILRHNENEPTEEGFQ